MLFILTIPYVIDLLSGLRSLLLTLEVFSLKDIEIYWKYDVKSYQLLNFFLRVFK